MSNQSTFWSTQNRLGNWWLWRWNEKKTSSSNNNTKREKCWSVEPFKWLLIFKKEENIHASNAFKQSTRALCFFVFLSLCLTTNDFTESHNTQQHNVNITTCSSTALYYSFEGFCFFLCQGWYQRRLSLPPMLRIRPGPQHHYAFFIFFCFIFISKRCIILNFFGILKEPWCVDCHIMYPRTKAMPAPLRAGNIMQ